MFVTNLVIGFIVSSITAGFIMIVKRIFQRQLSAKWQYNLWFLLLIALTIPLIPSHFMPIINIFSPFASGSSADMSFETGKNGSGEITNTNWMQDFSVTVHQTNTELLNIVIASVWIAGVILFTAFSIHAWFQLREIKQSISKVETEEIITLFEKCKQQLKISKNITLGVSQRVRSPLTFGLIKTYVVLPQNFEEWLSKDDIKHIFLHELNHYKYKDIPTSYVMAFYQIIYWFNPLVWIAFKAMRLDREIACDIAVLKSLDAHSYRKYGHTIIHFIEQKATYRYNRLANQLNGSKKQIKRRVQEIASFQTESKLLKMKSIGIFLLVGLFVASQIPFVSALASGNDRYNYFHHEQTVYEDLSTYFDNYQSSFVLYDVQADTYHIHNKDHSTTRISPDSTYKIYIGLFGLEEGVITSEQNTIEWDGTKQPFDKWNENQNLATAFAHSVNWYFQEIDKETGQKAIQSYIQQIHYGNQDMSGGLDQYWLESSLKISPVEQVELLQSFYNNTFNFQGNNIQTIKNALQIEEKDGAVLYGKTGTGNVNGKGINGWFIGFVETETNTYFFATNIQDKENASGSTAAEITLSILRDKQIYN
ncbi:BlaR1 family beta-lactam sensor/signal transducer [Gracilibacillus alcaliphilus]|uniref:BlaR1 family beta-lactam sensor/signal transducer n=1 Tax=Gracilibacillus alcaliphilus TaxID=1401441 RepID=UPI00195A7013|nr:BlaR1 family beta-lactam sensor/signal transducer [Gracilibacillus alcaliphilus]MBM7679662.1 bla regulator protein BlaR1 [Gracilibacillus alcaliphilus]